MKFKKTQLSIIKKNNSVPLYFFQASYPCLQRDYWYVHVLCFPSKPCNQSDIYYLKSRLHHIFKKRKKKIYLVKIVSLFKIIIHRIQIVNVQIMLVFTQIYCAKSTWINLKPTHSNNMNCCWWHVNRMEWNIKYIYTCIYNYV